MRQVGTKLRAAAHDAQAYGLAAAHIGLNEPVVVISTSEPNSREYLLMFNPEIIKVPSETVPGAEGSVSMPGIEVDVERPVWVEIAFDDEDGVRHSRRIEGFVARCALHEIDQMNGKFFLSCVSRLKRDAAIRKYEKSRSRA